MGRLRVRPAGGETLIWATFPSDTEYFGRHDQQTMINYRVGDLDAMLAQLRRQAFGRWAAGDGERPLRWGDPEGNRFELWEPGAGQ